MRKIRFGLLVAITMLVLGGTLTPAASARELIKFTKEGHFETNTGHGLLEVSNGEKVECEKIETKGEVVSEVKAVVLTLYVKCTGPDGSTCTSASAPQGDIHVPHILVLLGSDENPAVKMSPAVLLQATNPETGEPTGVEAKCDVFGIGSEVSLHGSQICLIKNAPKEEIEVSCLKGSKAGEQQDKHFWDASDSGVESKLLASATGIETFSDLEANIEGVGHGHGMEIQIET